MLKSIKITFIIPVLLMVVSCNGQSQAKSQISADSDRETKVNPYIYDSGDVTTKGLMDKQGNMWFTTLKEGVFKYDGVSFTNYTVEDGLCANQVWTILEDKNGLLWFGTENGLCSFDGKRFNNIALPKPDKSSVQFPWKIHGIISMIQDKQGIFWIGTTGNGAFRYDGKEFTSFLKNEGRIHPDNGLYNNCINSILEDTLGNIWFSSFTHGGISKFDGKTMTHFGLENGLEDDMIAFSYMDKSGQLWFGTRDGGMSYFNGIDFTTIIENDHLCKNNMATMFEDSRGNFWVGSYARGGICLFNGDSFALFDVENNEKLKDIRFITEDKENNIWFGGRYGLLWRYDGKELKDFTQKKRNE